jgi:hypothetical protein
MGLIGLPGRINIQGRGSTELEIKEIVEIQTVGVNSKEELK